MRWQGRIKWLFLLPAVLWVLAFTVFPLGYSLYVSLFNIESKVEIQREKVPVLDEEGNPVLLKNGKPRMKTVVHRTPVTKSEYLGFVNTERWSDDPEVKNKARPTNYQRLFDDPQVNSAVKATAIFVLVAVPVELILGLALAFLFNHHISGRALLRSLMILPIFATPLAAGYVFFTIFYEEGGPLGFLGIPFLSNPGWALASVIFVDIWQWTPFCFLVFLAALQSISEEQIEAALLDTSSNLQLLRYVILPALIPTIVIVMLLRLAEALKLFDIPFALTGGGPGIATQSYSFLAYRTGLRFFDFGYASAMSYGMLVVVMIIVLFFFKRLRENYV